MKNQVFMKRQFIILILVCCTVYLCGWGKDLESSREKSASYWEPAAPEEQGLDSRLLLQMLQQIRDKELNLRSIIVVRNHRLVLECYVHPYTRDTLHNTKSASKSIISALTGIALREKKIEDLDRTVLSYFPQYITGQLDPRKHPITLRHLLTMSSGLKIGEQTQDTGTIFANPDPVKAIFEFPMAENPGERFNYLTPLALVMAVILKESSGKTLQELSDTYLFAPLGIINAPWKENPQGFYFTDVALRPLDMARFGVLYLDKGEWEGKQVVPAEWIEASTKDRIKTGETSETLGRDSYGYFWWRNTSKNMFMALGWGGQQIYVMPGENMVIVTTASDFGAALQMVYHFIIPAVKTSKPLPPNPQVVRALRQITGRLQSPSAADARPVPAFPAIVKEINGKTYRLEPNIAGLVSMAFAFREKSCHLTLGTEKGTSQLEVGLDNIYRVSDSGRYGERLEHNKMALRGRWKSSDTFFLDFHSVGRPEQGSMDLCFQGESLTISVAVVGTEIKFPIHGKRES
jgi:CubicO group peptidase (beta-lactamase class C family)